MTLRSVARRARNLLRHPGYDLIWFAPTWLLLGAARAAILLLSFRRLATALGSNVGPHAWIPLLTAGEEVRARRIGYLVRWVAAHTPWTSDCFPQAVAARLLLALYRVPCAVLFGLERDHQRALLAHAWVVSGCVSVTGGASFGRFSVVACFTSVPTPDIVARR